jgi:hypothetical protein
MCLIQISTLHAQYLKFTQPTVYRSGALALFHFPSHLPPSLAETAKTTSNIQFVAQKFGRQVTRSRLVTSLISILQAGHEPSATMSAWAANVSLNSLKTRTSSISKIIYFLDKYDTMWQPVAFDATLIKGVCDINLVTPWLKQLHLRWHEHQSSPVLHVRTGFGKSYRHQGQTNHWLLIGCSQAPTHPQLDMPIGAVKTFRKVKLFLECHVITLSAHFISREFTLHLHCSQSSHHQ